MFRLLIEATFVGLLTLVIGTIVSFIVSSLFKTDLPSVCKDWNKNFTMEITLFTIGFIVHLVQVLINGIVKMG